MINNENSYYSKYLKYKKKYLDLKQLIGGGEEDKQKKLTVDKIASNPALALYVKSFEKFNNNESFCESTPEKIMEFDIRNIRFGTSIEFENYKNINSNWITQSFGELKNLHKVDFKEYCELYNEENKSVLKDDEGLYGEFGDGLSVKIKKSTAEEEEENNVVNLFTG